MEFERQLSEVFTLQFGTEYSLRASLFANSEAGQNEVPEPASVVLLVSGLGFMAGFVNGRSAIASSVREELRACGPNTIGSIRCDGSDPSLPDTPVRLD